MPIDLVEQVLIIWSSLWTAKEALKKGFRWVVGEGEDIEVFKDRGKRRTMGLIKFANFSD